MQSSSSSFSSSSSSSFSSPSLFFLPNNSQSHYDNGASQQMIISAFDYANGQCPAPISNVTASLPCCSVCSEPSNGTFFGVPSCRACSSFFRRSVLAKRNYLCRKANNCAIINNEGMRNSCRACRLKWCFGVGMDISQKHSKKPGQPENIANKTANLAKNICPQTIACSLSAAVVSAEAKAEFVNVNGENALFKMNMGVNLPNSFKFMQYFRNIDHGQRAFVNVLKGTGKIILDVQQLHIIRHDDHTQIKRGCIVLLLEHIREQFPQLNEQPTQTKVGIVKNYSVQSEILRICFSTLKFFPWQNVPIKHLVLNGCCFVSTDELDYFFSSHESVNEMKKYGLACVDSLRVIVSRLKPLNLSELELSALNGIQLWNCIERFVPLSDQQKVHRNAFFVELHAMAAAQNNGKMAAEIGIRFGLLMNLLLDTLTVASEMLETMAMADMFFPSDHSFCFPDAFVGALLNQQ
ncbi:hypothetical protein niasHS_016084 [Heterodera schachtii]|uniref:Nuclear receptor domain-containing protein n=1 Tax=Heterodera schachtii TaxID=97005 RepID=A0ABD2HZ14_HETSC